MNVHVPLPEESAPVGATSGLSENWPATRVGEFAAAESHSRKVRLLKRILPVAALALVVGFLTFAYRASSATVRIEADSSAVSNGHLVMSNPKLEGFTKEGRPYAVNATRAIQELGTAQSDVQLDRIDATLPLNAKGWMTVNAPGGIYNRAAKTLTLDGGKSDGIKVTSSDNTTVYMQTAVIDMTSGVIRARDNVDIKRENGALSAETAKISKDGKVLVFEKKVRMTLQPDQSSKKEDLDAKP